MNADQTIGELVKAIQKNDEGLLRRLIQEVYDRAEENYEELKEALVHNEDNRPEVLRAHGVLLEISRLYRLVGGKLDGS